MDSIFLILLGSTYDASRCKKADVIKYALESCNIKDLSKVIMIGDREYDIIGANSSKAAFLKNLSIYQ